ncbi:MAG: Adenylosuccinate lyase [Candidatus Magnetoglobus multicellularis str. Araruama]|uniref:Adenylosuccinate lyase n=1 Tax=Candidatus Magnetoglobus multicellularis str. Araruama TaxID=890399 RepID=A0A1V1P2Y9_9BACT|nr:MAG: Adenylosuccinate lyase [Candidatus Magnetoglobus multicellularis str. Araruama]
MIKRYTRPKMGQIWSEENKYQTWLQVETAACEAMAHYSMIPSDAVDRIKSKAAFSVKRIEEIEAETRHDVIAFLTNIAEHVGPDSRYIHMGMTSSDVLDTSMAIRLKQASEMILDDCDALMNALSEQAHEHKNTVMIGRSHGIHAEPITFGLKLAVWFDEMKRNRNRLENAKQSISVGMLSGAVGTYANIPPEIEAFACEKLGLTPVKASTQIIQRDRYAEFFTALAIMAATIEKIAVEIRHLQRTEVLEVEEHFAKGQKGSSAMPHKRNPVGSENMSGLARLIRSNAMAALENVALWHERDISHSSVERVIAPDSTILMDYMLNRLTRIIKYLMVYPDNMQKNLEKTRGLIFSQQLMLGLIACGITREDAYRMVQKPAMDTWHSDKSFMETVMTESEILTYLSKDKIRDIFNIKYHLKHVDDIFQKVFTQ